jgi:hypothetical protein
MDLLILVSKVQEVAGFLVMVLVGLIGLFMLIPGEEPEKTLGKILEVIKRFSKK